MFLVSFYSANFILQLHPHHFMITDLLAESGSGRALVDAISTPVSQSMKNNFEINKTTPTSRLNYWLASLFVEETTVHD